MKLLGVTFDCKLGWNKHVDNIVRNASRRLYVLRCLKGNIPNDKLIVVYNVFVRSLIEYASPLFIGMTKKNVLKLEKIQRRFHRILCGTECTKQCISSLSDRRERAAEKL